MREGEGEGGRYICQAEKGELGEGRKGGIQVAKGTLQCHFFI